MYYIYLLLGILIRWQIFDVNDGNDDWKELIHPEKYGLKQTQNFYIQVEATGKSFLELWGTTFLPE